MSEAFSATLHTVVEGLALEEQRSLSATQLAFLHQGNGGSLEPLSPALNEVKQQLSVVHRISELEERMFKTIA